ncbi:MAG TPA: hypothetical protein VJT83_03680, partial [Chitinophagaceae bacterium]|nr:hypothetical protein [Chitinophagaceae bacterium]
MLKGNKSLPETELKEIAGIAATISNDNSASKIHDAVEENSFRKNYKEDYSTNKPAQLFYFDPNTASKEEWERLGIREKTVRTILNYLSKGGHF